MADWKLTWLSPALGVREGHRLVARYVLREGDCRAGLAAQTAAGVPDVIAIADHSLDFHGATRWEGRELDGPYGVPFRCLLPDARTAPTTCSSPAAGPASPPSPPPAAGSAAP